MEFSRAFLFSMSGFLFTVSLMSCKSASSSQHLDSELRSSGPNIEGDMLSRTKLRSAEEYTAFAVDSSGLIAGGKSVKFLIDFKGVNGHKAGQVYFINANYNGACSKTKDPQDACNKYHYNFAAHELGLDMSLDQFNNSTYFENRNSPNRANKKAFSAGTLSTYALDSKVIYAIQLFPQDTASQASAVDIARIVKNAIKIPDAEVDFLPTGDQQISIGLPEALARVGVGYITLDKILGSRKFLPMNAGDAYGYLRLFPTDQEALVPTDIVVFDELPLDLSVVSGVITKAFQDSNSHINLKSRERNTPNMVLRDASASNEFLSKFVDKPIHLAVTKDGFKIVASTDAEVAAKYQEVREERMKEKPEVKWEPSKTIVAFDKMCPGNPAGCLAYAKKMGSKGANLGFLKEVFKSRVVRREKPLAYDPVPMGFAIPLQFYADFVKANPTLSSRLEQFIADENNGRLSNGQRSEQAAEIRQMFLDAEVPAADLKAIKDMMAAVNSTVDEWKIRSAANAEDIKNFDGAGLHDSYAAKLSKKDKEDHRCRLEEKIGDEPGEMSKMKVSPKTVSCAVKGVYASLWNKRAIDERSFAMIDHSEVAMGLAVVPTYDNEGSVEANSVVVTRVMNSELSGISLSIQDNNNTVTNPTPGTFSEVTIAISSEPVERVTLSTVRYAKPLAGGPARTTSVLSEKDSIFMAELARKIEEAYCLAKPEYYYKPYMERTKSQDRRGIKSICKDVSYDPLKDKALDMEFKVVCKDPVEKCAAATQVDREKGNYEFVAKQVREFSGN